MQEAFLWHASSYSEEIYKIYAIRLLLFSDLQYITECNSEINHQGSLSHQTQSHIADQVKLINTRKKVG